MAFDIAKTGDVALAGREGAAVERLLGVSMAVGAKSLRELAGAAIARILAQGRATPLATAMFKPREREELARALAAVIGTANVLGRAVVRDYQRRKGVREGAVAERPLLAEALDDVRRNLRPMDPQAAVEYFRGLVPTLGTDPLRFGELIQRQAFTLAVATEVQLLQTVQKVLTDLLATGAASSATPQAIQDVMDASGVSSRNPQYAEMVFRTNMMDSYNTGFQEEFTSPDVAEDFPVWQYAAIDDGRARPEHAARNGKYWPNGRPFTQVRGTAIGDVANCRCAPIPVFREDWEALQARGARVEP